MLNNVTRKRMQSNTSNDTSIEMILRCSLFRRGIRYRKNVKSILGKPDIAIKKYKLLVFCDGDFWHGKKYHGVKTNEHFWDEKIKRNRERDLENTIQLRDEGWTVLRFWESEIKEDIEKCVDKIVEVINLRRL